MSVGEFGEPGLLLQQLKEAIGVRGQLATTEEEEGWGLRGVEKENKTKG